LDDEHVLVADQLVDQDVDLAIRQVGDRDWCERDAKLPGYSLGERPIGRAGEEPDVLGRLAVLDVDHARILGRSHWMCGRTPLRALPE